MLRVVLVFACVVLALVVADPVVSNLNSLQLASGGFHEIGIDGADVHATSHALFLAALYGQKSQINADDASLYVAGMENGNDFGYAKSPGATSDLESTRFALLSFIHLGQDIPHASETAEFITSLFNVNNGLFGSFAGDVGDLKSTALAIESLSILGQLEKPAVQDMLKRTKDMVAEKLVSSDTSSYFSFDEASTTPLSDNYYGLYLASKSGFDFSEPAKFGAYINQLQDLDRNSNTFGGFYTGEFKTAVTAEATAHAALSLSLLGLPIGQERALAQYSFSRKSTLADTSFGHLALAHTSLFKSTLSTHIAYSTNGPYQGGEQVMEGLLLTPRLVVTLFDGKIAHGGFEVTTSEAGGWSSDLVFDFSSFYYVADQTYDTTDKLGRLTLQYELKSSVYPIGDIELSVSDSRTVGYSITVEDKAVSGGRDVEVGGSVMPGSEFEFTVDLSTHSNPSFNSGDFLLEFKVLDASGVQQHSSSIDGNTNSEEIVLSYTLSGDDFPAGDVAFLFQVSKSGNVHSSRSLVYSLQQQMVAANIVLEDDEITLGSTLEVTMEAGTLKDLQTMVPYSSASSKRSFVLDLVSPKGVTVKTISGSPAAGDTAKYEFSADIPSSTDFIGTLILSFRFVPVSGESVKLHPFDVAASELYEDASSVQINVQASLQLSNVAEEPKETDLTYGTQVPFTFGLVDTVSDTKVTSGVHSGVYVTMSVDSFVGSKVEATSSGGMFMATLNVDANSLAGAAVIAIQGSGVDGDVIPITRQSGESVEYSVTVGGDIDVSSSTFTTSTSVATKTAVVAVFSLSCNGSPLTGANLYATVLVKNDKGTMSTLTSGDREFSGLAMAGDESGTYSLSFTLPHSDASTGDYKLEFTRMVDLDKAEHTGTKSEPLFDIEFQHQEVKASGFLVFPEVLVLLVIGTLFWTVSNHQMFGNKKMA